MVLVQLDAGHGGVQVPAKHAGDPQLRLNLSYRFASRDLMLDGEGVGCTLNFSGVPFQCRLPYGAIYAATSHVTGEAVVWREDIPEGLPGPIAETAPAARAVALKSVPAPDAPERPPEPPEEESTPTSAPARARGHLRLIK
jgi:stringent starvation protein B